MGNEQQKLEGLKARLTELLRKVNYELDGRERQRDWAKKRLEELRELNTERQSRIEGWQREVDAESNAAGRRRLRNRIYQAEQDIKTSLDEIAVLSAGISALGQTPESLDEELTTAYNALCNQG